jgi:hypothetical protein
VLALIAGVLALVSRSSAQHEAQVALGRQLGAEAVSEPRIDLAMLLARESLNLDQSPQTAGTLLATLLRTPAVIGTFTVPIQDRPQDVKVAPDGRSIAAVTNNSVMRIYGVRAHRQTSKFAICNAPYQYVASGDLLVGPSFACSNLSLINPGTGRTLKTLKTSPFWQQNGTSGNIPLVSPDGRYAFLVYGLLNLDQSDRPPVRIESWRLDRGGPRHVSSLSGTGVVAATALASSSPPTTGS